MRRGGSWTKIDGPREQQRQPRRGGEGRQRAVGRHQTPARADAPALACPWRSAHDAFLKMTEALVPPNPKLFDKAMSIFIGLALFGTKSSGVSTEGWSRLMVGGATWSRSASTQNAASTAPAAPKRWPIDDLVDDIAVLPEAWPSSRSTAPSSISSPSGVEVPWALM